MDQINECKLEDLSKHNLADISTGELEYFESTFDDDEPNQRTTSEGKLQAVNPREWIAVRTEGDRKKGLYLLMTSREPRVTELEERLLPIPLDHEIFVAISAAYQVPSLYLEVLERAATVLLHVPNGFFAQRPESYGYILHNTQTSSSNFCLSVTHSPKHGVITAFIHGLQTTEIAALTARLRRVPAYHAIPTLLATLLLETRLDVATQTTRHAHELISALEAETGMHPQWARGGHPADGLEPAPPPAPDRTTTAQLDLHRITHDLTAISARLAHYSFIFASQAPMYATLDALNAHLLALSPLQPRPPVHQLAVTNAAHATTCAAARARAAALAARVAAQRDTVLALAAQRDSAVANALARIAARDAASMRLLAQATARDASAMRAIAVVTVWFLPATFLASVCGAGFFDWGVGSGDAGGAEGRVSVSRWLWVYFAGSLALTAVVQMLWVVVEKREKRGEIGRMVRSLNGSEERVEGLVEGMGTKVS